MSSKHQLQGTAEEARALLSVFRAPPPPDFATQVLARAHAQHTARLSQAARHESPAASEQSCQDRWQTTGYTWSCAWRLPGAVASGLLVAAAIVLWLVYTQTPAALTPDKTACTLASPVPPETSDQTSLLPPAPLQSASAPELALPHTALEIVPHVPQAESPTPDHSALSAGLILPSPGDTQVAPQPQPLEQHRSLRGKSRRPGRGLRLNKA